MCTETWTDSRIVRAHQNEFVEILTEFTKLQNTVVNAGISFKK